MLDRDNLFCHDVVLKINKQIEIVRHDSCRGVLDGQNCIVRTALGDRLHRIAESRHMEAVDILPEKRCHGSLAVGSLDALKDHADMVRVQPVNADERQPPACPPLLQHCVLLFPAHGHEL